MGETRDLKDEAWSRGPGPGPSISCCLIRAWLSDIWAIWASTAARSCSSRLAVSPSWSDTSALPTLDETGGLPPPTDDVSLVSPVLAPEGLAKALPACPDGSNCSCLSRPDDGVTDFSTLDRRGGAGRFPGEEEEECDEDDVVARPGFSNGDRGRVIFSLSFPSRCGIYLSTTMKKTMRIRVAREDVIRKEG